MKKSIQLYFRLFGQLKFTVKFLLYSVVLILPLASSAQHFIKQWAVQSESELWGLASDFTIAKDNTIFLAGNYNGNATILSADRKTTNISHSDSRASDLKTADQPNTTDKQSAQGIFVAAMNQEGAVQWVKNFTNIGYAYFSSIKASDEGLCIAGYFQDELQCDGIQLKANHKTTAFVARLDFAGNVLWAKPVSGEFTGQKLFAIPLGNKNTLIAGTFAHTICLPEAITIPNSASSNIFAALLDSTGAFTKTLVSKGTGNHNLNDVIADKHDNFYLAGSFEKSISMGNKSMQSAGKTDGFIFCFTKTFEPVYTKQIGSIYNDDIQGIATDNKNNLIATGGYAGDITSCGIKFPAVNGNTDVFVVKFDAYGNPVWADGFGSKANDYATSVVSNRTGRIYISGSSRGSIRKENFFTTANNTGGSLFIAKYSAEGLIILLDALDANRTNFNRKIEIDDKGYLLLSGNFHKTIPEGKTEELNNNPDNFHLTKLFDCDAQPSIQLPADTILCGTLLDITADSSFAFYNWNTGRNTNHISVDTSGTYILKVTDNFGCISADSMHVEINPLPFFSLGDSVLLISHEPFTLFGPANMKEYHWSDNSTMPWLTLPKNHIYPAEVTLQVKDEKGCMAENRCIIFSESTFTQLATKPLKSNDFTALIYPVPAREAFTAELSSTDFNNSILFELVSSVGKVIIHREEQSLQPSRNFTFKISDLAEGVYALYIKNGTNTLVKQIIITK